MKLIFFAAFLILNILTCCKTSFSQTPSFSWAKGIGGTQKETANDITLDAAGNIYMTGSFEGTVDFDPGVGTYYLTSNGGDDVFILKTDSSGNLLWAKSVGGTGIDIGYAIAFDTSGNCLVTGSFQLIVDFDPGMGVSNFTAAGGDDAFILKLDTSGNFSWTGILGGSGNSTGSDIVTVDQGYIYIAGSFSATNDFDPGGASYILTSSGNTDGFVCKLSLAGNFMWAGALGGQGSDAILAMALDDFGNVHTTGSFYGTADFDPGPGTANLGASALNDIFIAKWNTSGNFIWAKNIGGPGSDMGRAITVDTNGTVYTTGYFMSTADFDPGNGSYNLTAAGGWDLFISRLDDQGNFLSAGSIGGSADDAGNDLVLDASGNTFVAGGFNNIADFDPGTGSFTMNAAGLRDAFIAGFDMNGNFMWARQAGSTGFDDGTSLCIDNSGSIYVTGVFSGIAYFDVPGSANLATAGEEDIFAAKYGPGTLNLPETVIGGEVEIFPNPSIAQFTVVLPSFLGQTATISILDCTGKIIRKENLIDSSWLTISVRDLVVGLYFLKIEGPAFVVVKKIAVVK